MDGGVGAIGGAVRNRVGLGVELGATLLVFELVAKQAEEWGNPEIPGLGSGERIFG